MNDGRIEAMIEDTSEVTIEVTSEGMIEAR